MLNRLRLLNNHYIENFTNSKIRAIGTTVGACCGIVYLSEYYSTKMANETIKIVNETANEIKKENKQSTQTSLFFNIFNSDNESDNIFKEFANPFSFGILPSMPLSFNILTTSIMGGFIGYTFATYYPVTISAILIGNLFETYKTKPAVK